MSTISASTTSTTAYKVTADTTGTLVLQTGATPTTAMTIATDQKITLAQPLQGGSITSATAVASTSGTSIDFTGIPSWAKRITVMYAGVSTNGTSLIQVQIGSGSVVTTGYVSNANYPPGPTSSGLITSGFIQVATIVGAASTQQGFSTLVLQTGNTWLCNGAITDDAGRTSYNAGSKSLSGTLDRVRITTVNGTDTFDAGTINIMYEG